MPAKSDIIDYRNQPIDNIGFIDETSQGRVVYVFQDLIFDEKSISGVAVALKCPQTAILSII
jgi:hypothetical protein